MERLAFNLPGDYSINPVRGMPSGGLGTAVDVLRWGVTVLFIAISITSLFFLIWGGIQWITSGGDKQKIEAARNRLVYALIGLIIAFLAFFIINTIGDFLGVKLLGITVPR
ncbi:MAG: hypothetical protein HYW63_01985 [Candidatus Levybacteria bacterium]|nr:hypothetical protein [Candidatus Levybacteria bacterium]